MDSEMNFPNPVVRTDLPTKKRRWPKVVAGLLVLGLLGVAFLPQILSTRVGRRIVVAYLVKKTGSNNIVLENFKTSWFGGTTIQKLWVKDPLGRRIGFESLTCKASLLDLLRGNYKLGDATIDGLGIDYVVDDGRGGDSRRLLGFEANPDGGLAGTTLPRLSGSIKVTNGRVALWRGTVQQKLYDVKWHGAEFKNVRGQLDVPSLDQPWTYTLSADATDEEDKAGPIASSGTVDLGAGGRIDSREMALDLTFEGREIRPSAWGPIALANVTPDDAARLLGPSVTIGLKVKAADGKVTFERFDVEGPVAKAHAQPTFDLTGPATVFAIGATPRAGQPAATGAAPASLTLGVTKRVGAGYLAYLSPFFKDAAGGGTVSLTFDYLRVPLWEKNWRGQLEAKGHFAAQQVVLARADEITGDELYPKNMASQLALLTGDEGKSSELSADGAFAVAEGKGASSTSLTAGGVAMTVEAVTDVETGGVTGTANVTAPAAAGPALAGKALVVPLGGSVRDAQLALLAPRGKVNDAVVKALGERVNEQAARMREKETQRLMNKAQAEVQSVVGPFKGMERASQPGGKKE